MKKKVAILAAGLALAMTGRADLIHLTGGGHFRGEVTGLSGAEFVVKTAGGAVTNLSADSVTGVDFEHGYVTATLDTKSTGSVIGKLWLFAKQNFHVEDAKGETHRIPLVSVLNAAFTYTPGPERSRPVLSTPVVEPVAASRRVRAEKPDVEIITHRDRVDILRHLADGKVTVVDFYATWCGPCRNAAPILEEIAQQDADVAIRKVDIAQWGSPVADQYDITSIPRLLVYDRRGRLVRTLAGFNEDDLRASIDRAKAGN